jgi:hypothetical protein
MPKGRRGEKRPAWGEFSKLRHVYRTAALTQLAPYSQLARPQGEAFIKAPERLLAGYVRHVANRATVVTPKAEEYRAKARECEECAEQTRDTFFKQQIIDIAEQWRTMAAYEEKYAR